jgi:hypothetical protein
MMIESHHRLPVLEMTYISAWKSDDAVYILADSAATARRPATEPRGVSSFGEAPFTSADRSVSEGAIKIRRLGPIAAAFSGSAYFAERLADRINGLLFHGAKPAEAIAAAVESLDSLAQLSMVATFVGPSGPELLVFTAGNTVQKLQQVNAGGVHLGSAPEELTSATADAVRTVMAKADTNNARDRLALVLACVQGYGLRQWLMQHGVGGAFVGLVCHAGGIEWQGDTLYCFGDDGWSNPECVMSVVHRDCHVVFSTVSNGTAIFIPPIRHAEFSNVHEWAMTALRQARESRFSYVVLLNTMQPIGAVVAMNGEPAHKLVTTSVTWGAEVRTNLLLSPEVQHGLRVPLNPGDTGRIIWHRYSPPEPDAPPPVAGA